MCSTNSDKALTVNDIQAILKIGSNTAYSLIHSKVFPVKRIGRSYRIPAEPFYEWLEGQKNSTKSSFGAGTSSGAATNT